MPTAWTMVGDINLNHLRHPTSLMKQTDGINREESQTNNRHPGKWRLVIIPCIMQEVFPVCNAGTYSHIVCMYVYTSALAGVPFLSKSKACIPIKAGVQRRIRVIRKSTKDLTDIIYTYLKQAIGTITRQSSD